MLIFCYGSLAWFMQCSKKWFVKFQVLKTYLDFLLNKARLIKLNLIFGKMRLEVCSVLGWILLHMKKSAIDFM